MDPSIVFGLLSNAMLNKNDVVLSPWDVHVLLWTGICTNCLLAIASCLLKGLFHPVQV